MKPIKTLVQLFKQSIHLPNKKVVFGLNRVTMRDALTYLFVLLFILLLPDGIDWLSNGQMIGDSQHSVYVLLVITFYPMYVIFSGLIGSSLLAVGGFIFAKICKRNLAYQHIWKMSLFALTIPLMLNTILSLLGWEYWLIQLFLFGFFYIILVRMVMIYPKK
ncbi:DUF1189 family protein [Aquibacillus albus]|uniref:DUF1189 domain-containing protein n=1 Tax=Aquibacillus albus TaxID=1168171 RepID=A0ABS2MY13_9BACI|nr:DUF1189 family protein [Aquibacillus albus]MBM7570769.1 hypothetical protein [Aquibacillus albus]